MNASTSKRKSGIRRRRHWRWAVGLNVLVSLLLFAVLVLLINLLAARYYWRTDVSELRAYDLSDKTERLLEQLSDPLDIVLLFQRGNELFHDIENLLREYQYLSPFIRVEYVDPDRNLPRAEALAREHNVDEPNVVVVRQGDRRTFVTPADLVEYDFGEPREEMAPARARFRGEQALSSAIRQVTMEEASRVYFLVGHGERRIDNFDPAVGYSSIARSIRNEHIELAMLQLGAVASIPDDADALIIAGPTRRLSQPELDLIAEYVDQSGRVLMLLDSMTDTGLRSVLTQWNVALGDDVVIDPLRSLTGRELFVTDYGLHPITERIRDVTTIFYRPRSVAPMAQQATHSTDHADKPHVTVLASSSDSGWAERDPEHVPIRFEPAIDRAGPVPIAVAVERGPVPGIDVQIRATRLVVFGDSGFVSNGALTGGDKDFFMSALSWLLEREALMAIPPRDMEWGRLVLDKQQMRYVLGWALGGLPGLAAALGFLVWLRRRR